MNDKEIIKIIETVIHDKGQIDLLSQFNSLTDQEIDRIISLVTGKGKYMLDKVPITQSWVLRKNPAYKNQLAHDIKVTLISAALALLTGYILWLIDNRSKRQEIQELQNKVQNIENRLIVHFPNSTKK
jgi:hypothetical protein